MPPLFIAAEGQERDALADRRADLVRIGTLYARLLDSPGANTSQAFKHWSDMEAAAKYLLRIIDEGGLEVFLDGFAERAQKSLFYYYAGACEQKGGSA